MVGKMRKVAMVECERKSNPTSVPISACNDCKFAKMINNFGIVECTYDEVTNGE
jgi:hypothetical protein